MFFLEKSPIVSKEAFYYLRSFSGMIIIGIFGATNLPKKLYEKLKGSHMVEKSLVVLEPVLIFGALLLSTAYLIEGSFNPFLYFRF